MVGEYYMQSQFDPPVDLNGILIAKSDKIREEKSLESQTKGSGQVSEEPRQKMTTQLYLRNFGSAITSYLYRTEN